MVKKDNIFIRAKAYVAAHPRTSFQDAIQKVKSKKISGVKKISEKKILTVKPKRMRITTPKKVVYSRVNGSGKSDLVYNAKAIVKKINKLEKERSAVKNKELKDVLSLAINGEHYKLNFIKKQLQNGKD